MGSLVAMRYPTVLFAKLADHTYVRCGNGGKAWGCWGGSSGGEMLISGTGSTKRADKIAGSDGKAGISCYLVNGVCHQAANRILSPANILVEGARGYSVSSLMFGTYGKVGIWPCRSPFHRHTDVHGGLPECVEAAGALDRVELHPALRANLPRIDPSFMKYVRGAYTRYMRRASHSRLEEINFATNVYQREVESRLGRLSEKEWRGLEDAKAKEEIRHAALVVERENKSLSETDAVDFITEFNALTEAFQHDIANCLTAKRYKQLMNLDRDDILLLADPDILRTLYGDRVVKRAFGID